MYRHSDSLTYRHLQPDDVGPCSRLLTSLFGSSVSAEELNWKSFQNPNNASHAWVGLSDGEIVGLLNVIPRRIQVGSHRGLAFEATDVGVKPLHRAQGVLVIKEMTRLMSEEVSSRGDTLLLYGVPNRLFYPYSKKFLRYQSVMAVPQLALVLNPAAPLLRRIPGARKLCRGSGLCRIPIARAVTFGMARRTDLEVVHLNRFGADCDALWEASADQFDIIIQRTSEQLNWRFVQRPSREYRIVSVRDSSALRGYAVLGFTQDASLRKAYVADFFTAPNDQQAARLLIRSAVLICARGGADVVTCWAQPGSPFYGLWRRGGFLPNPQSRHLVTRAFDLDAIPGEAERLFQPRRWYVTHSEHDIY